MEKAKTFFRRAGILSIVAGVLFFGMGAQGVEKATPVPDEERADGILIDGLKAFGKLDRPPVLFLHDAHTDAAEKKKKDCKTCHLEVKKPASLAARKALSPKYKRLEDTDKDTVTDIYHSECIACHREVKGAGDKSGPVEICGDCHREHTQVASAWVPMEMDKSLHYRHIEATKDQARNEDKCDACHHEYDEIAKKLVYQKDKEGSCLYCHKDKTEENRMSSRLASHLSCVDCHRRERAKNPSAEEQKVGPIKCSGCHALENQKKIKVIKDVPRIKRKQPDYVLIQPVEAKDLPVEKKEKELRIAPVPFNHKAHEGYNATCRVCHHASLDSCCANCHTLEGIKDGNYVKLAQAMHDPKSEHSCIGCHDQKQMEKECAGCHAFIPKRRQQESAQCEACHMKAPPEVSAMAAKPEEIAKRLIDSRGKMKDMFKDDDIPEKVVIKKLVDKYEPSEFPHRKVYKTIVKNIKDNTLANSFHLNEGVLCQGCHHGAPATKNPPTCASCHGKPFDERNVFRPGMLGAYHQQCSGCHQEMALEKPKPTDCEGCHKEKKK